MSKSKDAAARDVKVQERHGLKAHWSGGEHLDPMFSDHLHLSRVNDQFYLTFGQLRPAIDQPDGTVSPLKAEIRPQARLIVPKSSLASIVALLVKGLETNSQEEK